MIAYRVRVGRETPASGGFEWAALDAAGTVLEHGTSELLPHAMAGSCDVVLASDLVLIDQVELPAAQQRRVSGALRFLVEDRAIPDPERLHVVAAATSDRDRLCTAVVDRQWFQSLIARLRRAGLAPRSAVPECLLAPLTPGAWTVVCNGRESFARTGELEGFALDGMEDGAPPAALRLALDHAQPQKIVLLTAAGGEPVDAKRWTEELGVPVEPGTAPWRWSEAPWQGRLELLQGELGAGRADRSWVERLRRPALLAGALVLVSSAGIALDWASKTTERRALLAEMQAIYRQTFGEGAVVVDAPLQMERALAELRRRSGESTPSDFLPLLAAVAGRMLDPARTRILGISYERGGLAVSLQPHDANQLAAIVEELRSKSAMPGFQAKLQTMQSQGAPMVRLTVAPEGSRWASARP